MMRVKVYDGPDGVGGYYYDGIALNGIMIEGELHLVVCHCENFKVEKASICKRDDS